jgi:hypothetical protein
MSFKSWLRHLKSVVRDTRPVRGGAGARRKPARCRPTVEALENRLVPAAVRPGFSSAVLERSDDGVAGPVSLGFTADFFGADYSDIYVNNNGNVTFGSWQADYTPFGLTGKLDRPIIAPFFADVDTRVTPSGEVTYGTGTVDGHAAFAVTWPEVGYFLEHTDKLNTFQVVLISRPDTGENNFDIEFNYDQIQWETGDGAQSGGPEGGGSGGLGGVSAFVGFAKGTGDPGTYFELSGSGVPGSFLDSNATTGLTHNRLNSSVDGRYVFAVRNGALAVNHAPTLSPIGDQSVDEESVLSFTATASDPDPGTTLTYSLVDPPDGASIGAATGQFTWTPTEAQGQGTYTFAVRVSDDGSPALSDEETITVTVNEVNTAPTLDAITVDPVNEGSPVSFLAAGHDADLVNPGQTQNTLTYSLVGAPAGSSIDPTTGAFSWTPTDSGTYTFTVRVSDDGTPSLSADRPVTITVNNVAPTATLSNDGPKTYGDAVTVRFSDPFDPSSVDTAAGFTYAYSLDGVNFTPTTSSSAAFNLNAGTYTVSGRIYDKDGDYNEYSTQVIVNKATPTVTVGGGTFTYDKHAHPATGSVTGVGGVSLGTPTFTYSHTDDDGNVVTTAAAPVEPGYYTVTASFAGDANYLPQSATATITIAYEARTLTNLSRAMKAGRTIPIKLRLTDAAGNNVSSPETHLTALRLERVNADGTTTQVTLQDAGHANPGDLFRYDASLGGYIFNLSTKGLGAGTYNFFWTAEGDPTEHELSFRLV